MKMRNKTEELKKEIKENKKNHLLTPGELNDLKIELKGRQEREAEILKLIEVWINKNMGKKLLARQVHELKHITEEMRN